MSKTFDSNKPHKEVARLKGLDNLFGKEPSDRYSLELKLIVPFPKLPRHSLNSQSQEELVESIRQHGILQPLVVIEKREGGFQLIIGKRRYEAAKTLKFTEVPAVILPEMDDCQAIQYSLLHNLQQERLNKRELYESIIYLLSIKFNLDNQEIINLANQIYVKSKKNNRPGESEVLKIQDKLSLIQKFLNTLGLSKGELSRIFETFQPSNIDDSVPEPRNVKTPELDKKYSLENRLAKAYEGIIKIKVWDNPEKSQELEHILEKLEDLLTQM
ncbi:MAG: ParB/RepB/Spo0J family partition protein [Arthrospira sp. SH-MAG29]|nr:ParB/RepB/Spo0J family partition protein [Arthrospira sp. SH-MAG29]MBS0015903.1 ParB/RepB/Spo0J family partition protein [Arthrospira sp. SH-MAG29]